MPLPDRAFRTARAERREPAPLGRILVQTRRAAVLSAAAVALSALSAAPGRAAAAPASRPATPAAGAAGRGGKPGLVRVALPAPGGPHPVGTLALRLVDRSRPDPWTAHPYRELMVSVRYPAREVSRHPRAPQMLPGEAAAFARLNGLEGVPGDRVDWAATRTHAHQDAPPAPGRFPVVLYSPGAGDPRGLGTTLCDDLASRGFVVVAVDHTYDAVAVEFPGGRVALTVLPEEYAKVVPDPAHPDPAKVAPLLRRTVAVRVADTRFVLDRLPGVLPPALRGAADLGRVGMFGHSAGGFTALQAMDEDPRIRAAADFDGVLAYVQEDGDHGYLSPVAAHGLDRPFLLVGKDGNTRRTVPSWDALWQRSTGPRHGMTLRGAQHATYTDAEPMVPQIARALHLPDATVGALVGTIAPRRAIATERACLTAFFTHYLGGGRGPGRPGPLEWPARRFPDLRPFD
jgi:dienelactone hydrolase